MIGRVIRLRVALDLNPKTPLLFLSKAGAICTGLGDKTLFPNPNPPLPTLLSQLADATTAQQSVGKVTGAAKARDAKFAVLLSSLESECTMVQTLCDANPAQAEALVVAASMKASGVGGHRKPLLAAKNGVTGTVLLDANAGMLDGTKRLKTYLWQMTANNGATFSPLPSTPSGKTTVAGLTPLTTVGFQVCVSVHKQPVGSWSQTVSILVR